MKHFVTIKLLGVFVAALTAVFVAMFGFSISMNASAISDIYSRALERATEVQRLTVMQADTALMVREIQTLQKGMDADLKEIKQSVRNNKK